jgi:hypothetical protein
MIFIFSIHAYTMSELSECLQTCSLYDGENKDLIMYIQRLHVTPALKRQLHTLIENDNYNDYMQIYNICLENDIELPPL